MTGLKKRGIFGDLAAYLGGDVAEAARELAGKSDYSEFKLAEALGIDVNETRNLLYKLHDVSLATFIKKKDNKIGWYIHYWTFLEGNVTEFLLAEKRARLDFLKEKVVGRKKSDFFTCVNKCVSLDFDKAFELSFHCPECGSLLVQENNSGKVDIWVKEISSLEREVKALKILRSQERAEKGNENSDEEEAGRKAEGSPSPPSAPK